MLELSMGIIWADIVMARQALDVYRDKPKLTLRNVLKIWKKHLWYLN